MGQGMERVGRPEVTSGVIGYSKKKDKMVGEGGWVGKWVWWNGLRPFQLLANHGLTSSPAKTTWFDCRVQSRDGHIQR